MTIEKHTLDNGLSVVLRESHTAPVTTFWVWYSVGSRHEVPGITGIAHWRSICSSRERRPFPKGKLPGRSIEPAAG